MGSERSGDKKRGPISEGTWRWVCKGLWMKKEATKSIIRFTWEFLGFWVDRSPCYFYHVFAI